MAEVFSDRDDESTEGLTEALAAAKSHGEAILVTAYRRALGDYRKIDQIRAKLQKHGGELVVIDDPYRETPDHEAAFCTAVLKALRDYRQAKAE